VEIVDGHLEADGALISLGEDLNKDGHPVPIWFAWPEIEADAAMLVCWELTAVPGLARTPAYALAILNGNEEATEARIGRQAILTKEEGERDRPAPTVLMLIDEQALRRPVGTAETMRGQLEHLIAMSLSANASWLACRTLLRCGTGRFRMGRCPW